MDLTQLDHLVLGAPDLNMGIDHAAKVLGARPIIGGRHPQYGTHNAIVALGDHIYLEIIASDPDLPPPEEGVLWDLDTLQEPRLITWAMRTDQIFDLAEKARKAGLNIGDVAEGARTTPEGKVLKWRLTNPHAARLETATPFLIDWGETLHPAETAPKAGSLTALRFEHPQPDMLKHVFATLGLSVEVASADDPAIIAAVKTPNGMVELT